MVSRCHAMYRTALLLQVLYNVISAFLGGKEVNAGSVFAGASVCVCVRVLRVCFVFVFVCVPYVWAGEGGRSRRGFVLLLQDACAMSLISHNITSRCVAREGREGACHALVCALRFAVVASQSPESPETAIGMAVRRLTRAPALLHASHPPPPPPTRRGWLAGEGIGIFIAIFLASAIIGIAIGLLAAFIFRSQFFHSFTPEDEVREALHQGWLCAAGMGWCPSAHLTLFERLVTPPLPPPHTRTHAHHLQAGSGGEHSGGSTFEVGCAVVFAYSSYLLADVVRCRWVGGGGGCGG